jgi:glucose/arabinose dehydrogenase
LRLRPDGQGLERYAAGLRNPYGLDFDLYGQLWADDNGPDFGPPERLHQITAGGHYGFPYYADCAECPPAPAGLEITSPFVEFPPHATPTGLVVYTGTQFPLNYVNSLFVALWNPGPGGRVVRVTAERQVDDFVTGLWGPVAVVVAPDGSLVVADNLSGYLFRVYWVGA